MLSQNEATTNYNQPKINFQENEKASATIKRIACTLSLFTINHTILCRVNILASSDIWTLVTSEFFLISTSKLRIKINLVPKPKKWITLK
jgi:hypothetical protein